MLYTYAGGFINMRAAIGVYERAPIGIHYRIILAIGLD